MSFRVAVWAARWHFGVSRQKHGKGADDWIHAMEAFPFRPKGRRLADMTPMGASNKVEENVVKETSANEDQFFYLTRI